MAVYFSTDRAQALLNAFDAKIKQTEPKGKITTWQKIGNYYTHKSTEWGGEAFFEPHVNATQLIFNIIKPKDKTITVPVYGYYHGHLIETFLNHFDKDIAAASASPLCTNGDHCSVAA